MPPRHPVVPGARPLVTLSLAAALACCSQPPRPGPPAAATALAPSQTPSAPAPPAASSAAPGPARPRCSIAAPPPPDVAQDALKTQQLAETRGRLELLAIDGKALLVGTRPSPATKFSSGGSTWTQPAGSYRNQFYELREGALQPAKELQKGLWDDQDIYQASGAWPDIDVWATNYGNTAWETVHFHRGADQEWKVPAGDALWPAAEALKIPAEVCAGEACKGAMVVAGSRDIYRDVANCALGRGPVKTGSSCTLDAVEHWCPSAPSFERVQLPAPVKGAFFIAVPGCALVVGAGQQVLRDGVFSSVTPVAGGFDPYLLRASAGALWYLGPDGLHQLQGPGWRRVLAWKLEKKGGGAERTRYQLELPGQEGEQELTGFAAEGPARVLLSMFAKGRTALVSGQPR